jgi:MoxR-like ATPase
MDNVIHFHLRQYFPNVIQDIILSYFGVVSNLQLSTGTCVLITGPHGTAKNKIARTLQNQNSDKWLWIKVAQVSSPSIYRHEFLILTERCEDRLRRLHRRYVKNAISYS